MQVHGSEYSSMAQLYPESLAGDLLAGFQIVEQVLTDLTRWHKEQYPMCQSPLL